jgi:MFS-type transporter involved in bile tolerance (Atg22 family)
MAIRPSVDAASLPASPASEGVLANRDFVKLWVGETISLIGTQVTQFTIPLVALLTLNATVLEVGVLNALRFLPVLGVSLIAGVWLDQRKRRPILIGCALGNALLIGLVPITSELGVLSIGLLCAVVTLAGTLSVIFDVGALSYVPFLVERQNLAESNSKLQASSAVAGIAGPGLAGLLISLITAPITLSVDAVSYLFVIGGLIAVRKPEPEPDPDRARPPVRQQIAEGFAAVYGTPLLRTLLTQSAVLNVGFGAVSTVFTVYAVRHLGLSPFELGLTVAGLAAGALCGALLANRIRRRLGLGRALAMAITAVSLSPLLLLVPRGASALGVVILFAGWLGHGWGISNWNVNTITMRQALTPMHVLARMNATYRMLLFGALPAGALAGGALGRLAGLPTAMTIAVLVLLCPVIWLAFSPVFRLTEMPAGPLSENTPSETSADGEDE